MELRVLKYFLAIVREESITKAAESLHVTQPTLSKQLMELEEELGHKLFIRSNRKITLTDEGRYLYQKAREIMDLVDKTTSALNSREDVSGDIYIGGGESESMRFLAHTAKSTQKKHPHIHYHLFSGNGDDVTNRLDGGTLDFGVLIEPVDVKKYDFLRIPHKDTWGVLMRKDSPLSEKEVLRPEDLSSAPLFCSAQTAVSNELAGWFRCDYDTLNIIGTYNLLYTASLFVEAGVGYALCLNGLANISAESPLTFRPLEPPLQAGLVIVWKKYQVFSRAAQYFLDELRTNLST